MGHLVRTTGERIFPFLFLLIEQLSEVKIMDTNSMTKLVLITGTVYTDLKPSEVRMYMQGGVKTNTIPAYLQDGTAITLAVDAIEYFYV